MERQSQVTRELYEINLDTVRQLMSLNGEGLTRYVTLVAGYLRELSHRPDPAQLFELHRTYAGSLLDAWRHSAQQSGRILGGAFERATSALRGAWTDGAEVAMESATAAIEQAVQHTPADRNPATARQSAPARGVADTRTEAAPQTGPARGSVTESRAEATRPSIPARPAAAAPAAPAVRLASSQPAAKPVAKPAAAQAAKPGATPPTKPATRPGAKPAAKPTAEPAGDRELERINGVGAALARQLRAAGIETLSQLAAVNLRELQQEDHPLHALKGRMEADRWVQQARRLVGPGRR